MNILELVKNLGLRIRELRIAKGYKQGELADLLDMERSNLTRIENGKQKPNDENLLKIAEILGVELKDLFEFSHINPREILKSHIIENLNTLNDKELQYIYKVISGVKELH